jgi:dihydrofolate reductase
MSLDGFIAGPHGEADWITPDPDIDFAAIWAQFDTGLMGRRTYEAATKRLGEKAFQDIRVIVASRTMTPGEHPGATVIPEPTAAWAHALKSAPGKDIWLFGGSALFRSMLGLGCVDTIEVSLIPVVLGDGVPLLPPPYTPTLLSLASHKVYRSGRIALTYDVRR